MSCRTPVALGSCRVRRKRRSPSRGGSQLPAPGPRRQGAGGDGHGVHGEAGWSRPRISACIIALDRLEGVLTLPAIQFPHLQNGAVAVPASQGSTRFTFSVLRGPRRSTNTQTVLIQCQLFLSFQATRSQWGGGHRQPQGQGEPQGSRCWLSMVCVVILYFSCDVACPPPDVCPTKRHLHGQQNTFMGMNTVCNAAP